MTYTIQITFRQKKILDCIIQEGLTQTQTAQKLNCSVGNVNLILRRLMKKYPKLKLNVYQKQRTSFDVPDNFVREE